MTSPDSDPTVFSFSAVSYPADSVLDFVGKTSLSPSMSVERALLLFPPSSSLLISVVKAPAESPEDVEVNIEVELSESVEVSHPRNGVGSKQADILKRSVQYYSRLHEAARMRHYWDNRVKFGMHSQCHTMILLD